MTVGVGKQDAQAFGGCLRIPAAAFARDASQIERSLVGCCPVGDAGADLQERVQRQAAYGCERFKHWGE